MKSRLILGGSALAAAGLLLATLVAGGGSLARGGDAAEAAVAAAGPTNTSRPALTGTVREGQTLTASNGTWSGTGSITYGYQWQRCDDKGAACANVDGATNNTYTLATADVGSTIPANRSTGGSPTMCAGGSSATRAVSG